MNDFLVQHALQNVWCSPYQDRQAVLEMNRLTPIGGVKDNMDLVWDRVAMPVANTSFHVYQIGSNFPPQLNLPTRVNTWIKLSDLCVENKQVIDLFIKDGRQYPRTTTWIARTRNRNFIVATQIHPLISLLDDEPLLVRFYSNAYYDSPRWDGTSSIEVGGGKMASTLAIATLVTAFNVAQTKGFTYAFHNGEYVVTLSTANIKVGDVVEYLCDPSVYRVVDFPVSGLPSFNSTLDSLRKYLIHPNKADDDPSIQYRDDIDIYLYKTDTTGRVKGIYYYRYKENAVRMVTHADYSLPVSTVQGFVNGHPTWDNLNGLVVRVQMRRSGYERPLVFEHHHIHELYKLPDTDILQAMAGVNSTLPEWTADGLESSQYTYLMRAYWNEITLPRVLDAYGYDATAKLVGDTPQKMTILNGERFVVLPHGLTSSSTVYEFDVDGKLLGWYLHRYGGRYYARNATATSVEVISGAGGINLNQIIGNGVTTLDPNNGYRLYVSPKKARVITNEWVEVDPTDTTHVQVLNGQVYWTHAENHWAGCVKQDDQFLAYTVTIPTSYDLYRFSLSYTDVPFTVNHVAPGRVDLWLNKRRLIRDIDYVVNYPEFVIINKEYLSDEDDQIIDIRAYGFCRPDMTMEPSTQSGFVENGYLSYNGRYDLRDDKVVQITVDGGSKSREDVSFSENDPGIRVSSVYEGRPYEISDIVVPIRGETDYETYILRARTQDIVARISDYMTERLPEFEFPDAPTILELYKVFSPFMNRLVGDILDGTFTVPTTIMTDRQVITSIANYRYLLAYDPCLLGIDARHEVIHPVTTWATLSVTQVQYSYLERVISLILNDQVDLTHFLTIED